MSVTIKQNILTNNDCYRSGRTITPNSIQLHTIGTAQNSASALASYWNQPGVEACVQYCIDAEHEGLVYQFLPDNRRPWADAGYGNNNSIAVELMESDSMRYTGGANYTVTNEAQFKADVTRAYNTAVQFFAMKCKEYGWNPQEKMSNGLHRVYSHDEGRRLGLSSAHVDPTHIWNRYGWTMDRFRADVVKAMDGVVPEIMGEVTEMYRVRKTWADAKSQLGAYTVLENAKKNCPVGYTVYNSKGEVVFTASTPTSTSSGTQAAEFANLTEAQAAAKILEMAKKDYEKTGILASVTAAQMILESGYVKTELARKGNNAFGLKTTLSGNTWDSVWDGVSKVNIRTAEEYTPGVITYINADFRAYPDLETSMEDHGRYLLGAMNGNKKRYAGLTECKNYREAITLIRENHYATDNAYVSKVCNIIERFGLNKYDKEPISSTPVEQPVTTPESSGHLYRVGSAWVNGACQNQKGAFSVLANAKKMADETGLKVFDENGKVVYPVTVAPTTTISYYRVAQAYKDGKYVGQTGAYTSKSNAIAAAKEQNLKCFDPLGNQIYPDPKKSVPEQAVAIGLDIAANNKHGYNNSTGSRGGNPDYACSSFVADCYIKAGVDLGIEAGKVYTKDMKKIFTAHGFMDVFSLINVKSGSGLQVGDLLVKPNAHTEMYIGNGQLVGARGNYDKKQGDGSGNEISVTKYWNDGWTQCLRYQGKPVQYRVQAGAYMIKDNADKMMARVKAAGFDALIIYEDGEYIVQMGLFGVKSNAENLVRKAKDAGIVTIITEV